MANIMRWGGADITEPFRRFLEGDMTSWLRVEEYRDAGSMVVKAEVPGIDPVKDVDIELVGNDLRINVRHEEKSEHKGKEGYRSEFRYGTFSRTVSLPGPVSEGDIRATYDDGILEVRIPLPEETGGTSSRKIPVSRTGATAGAGGSAAGQA
ncbi:Hsp20/alpha crystallin family protein [Arthrobacter sp. MPF02]|uniref:Hsp20/alpha crystallin family protein n=1 Tax=Arthrobacter sp. MPF02 TaxID=3388492 RepID=UPI00398534DF